MKKQTNRLQSINTRLCHLGLAHVVHSINTHSIQSITTTPHDLMFGQKARRAIDLRSVSAEQFAHDEENLPNDVIGALKEHENLTDVAQVTTSSNVHKSPISLHQQQYHASFLERIDKPTMIG